MLRCSAWLQCVTDKAKPHTICLSVAGVSTTATGDKIKVDRYEENFLASDDEMMIV